MMQPLASTTETFHAPVQLGSRVLLENTRQRAPATSNFISYMVLPSNSQRCVTGWPAMSLSSVKKYTLVTSLLTVVRLSVGSRSLMPLATTARATVPVTTTGAAGAVAGAAAGAAGVAGAGSAASAGRLASRPARVIRVLFMVLSSLLKLK